MNRKSIKLWIVGLIIAALVLMDLAPMFVQAQEAAPSIQVAQQQQPRQRRTLMDMLFGPKQQPQVVQQAPVEQPRRKAPVAAAPAAPAKPVVEKAANATRLMVFGDSLGIDLGKALERFYSEDPNLVVINKSKASTGFVRHDYYDWNKVISDEIAANSFDLAVVFLGINDMQVLDEDGQSFTPLTEDWNKHYTARLNDVLSQLRAANKPVVWIGLPPVADASFSSDLSQITSLQRMASFSGGAEFLDIYEKFADENGQFASFGPNLKGENVRMRKDDGIHFSTAGSDKLAFYLSQAIRAFYRGGGVSIAVADPLVGTDAQPMLRPPYQGLGQIRLLEVAGAVIPLSKTPPRATDLITASTAPAAKPIDLEALMQAPIGRVDAFGVGIAPQDPDEEQP
ncbi:hypothetical protein JP74_15380 [Devosia sp. 17-2-E-8]|nr:hypothetical protein JP74_15380 [Devosia sp. 17-2-E-8]